MPPTENLDPGARPASSPPDPSKLDRGRFTFQHPWFEQQNRLDWEKLTVPLHGKKLQILEVGSFEGASTIWILDNLMSHPESTMTVIDTFAGGMEHQDSSDGYELASLESRFWANVSKCEHVGKLRVMKTTSDDALVRLVREGARFDFIYIDASHVAIDVLHDAVLCWRMLQLQGTMAFDDYTWKCYNEDCYNPRVAILSLIHCAAPELQAVETKTQLWVTKIPNHIPATRNSDPEIYYWDKPESFSLPVTISKFTH